MQALLGLLFAVVGLSGAGPQADGSSVRARGRFCDPATGCLPPSAFYANTASELYVVDLSSGSPRVTLVGPLGAQLTDLALSSQGTLFGVSFDGLYMVDRRTGLATLVGSLGADNVNSLAVAGSRLIAGTTDGELYAIDPTNGGTAMIGTMGGTFTSSGDLCFGPDGALFMTSQADPVDHLVRVDPVSGAASMIGATGLPRAYGLTMIGGQLVGLTEAGVVARIDTSSGQATVIGSVGVPFWGAS